MIGYCPKCKEYRDFEFAEYGVKKDGDIVVCEKCGTIVYVL